MPARGCYLYGIIRDPGDKDFGPIGLEVAGKPGRVHTLSVGSVAAVISDIPADSNILPLRKNLDPHYRVIREVMQASTIIPVTFGHVAKNRQQVERALQHNLAEIEAELDRLDGKVEMGLKVKWDIDNIFEYMVTSDQELSERRDQIFGRSYAPSQREKLELGQMFEKHLNREREDQTDRVVEAFRPCVCGVKVNPPKSDKSVMDIAFLVDRDNLKAFEERVYEVAGTFPSQFLFDYTGPLAPFNFAALQLETGR